MDAAIFISTADGLRGAGKRAIDGIEIDEQVCQVLNELFLILQGLHVLHGNLHCRVDGHVFGAFKGIDGIA